MTTDETMSNEEAYYGYMLGRQVYLDSQNLPRPQPVSEEPTPAQRADREKERAAAYARAFAGGVKDSFPAAALSGAFFFFSLLALCFHVWDLAILLAIGWFWALVVSVRRGNIRDQVEAIQDDYHRKYPKV